MIELTKQYKTRDGHEARVFALDGGEEYPVLGAVKDKEDNRWDPQCWTADGDFLSNGTGSGLDLIEVKTEPKAIPFSEIPVGAWFRWEGAPDTTEPFIKINISEAFSGDRYCMTYSHPKDFVWGNFFVVQPTAPIEWERV